MTNIVKTDLCFDDYRRITTIKFKVKGMSIRGVPLIVQVDDAVRSLSKLLDEEGVSWGAALNPLRDEIVDIEVDFPRETDLTIDDVQAVMELTHEALATYHR